jgi:nitroreductase
MTLITDTFNRSANTDAPLMASLAERWSPRGFDSTAVIDETTLTTILEAARWAPSAANTQPARFIVARRGSASFTKIHDSMMGFNKTWADSASVLIANVAVRVTDDGKPLAWADYDLGQAVAHLSIQAQHEGVHTHQMGGFDAAEIANAFSLPENQSVVSVIALGVLADVATLPAELLERESAPRTRKPLEELLLVND